MTNKEFFNNIISDVKKEGLNLFYAQLRQDDVIVEDYKNAVNKARLNSYSISKSFISCAAGIAEAEGLISFDEKICDAFPEYVPADPSPYLLETDLRHMLTMTTGLNNGLFFSDAPERYIVKDWIQHFFNAEFDHPAGQKFLYSNFNTYVLSALIEKRAGTGMINYLRDRLFEPLGIGNPDWTLCPMGHVYAGNGLYLHIDELGNFGDMLLQNGEYKGKQLVPKDYLAKATVKQVDSFNQMGSENLQHGYGYQFWMTCLPDTYLCYGSYGQYCLVMPKKGLALSTLSFEGNNHLRILDIIMEHAKEL